MAGLTHLALCSSPRPAMGLEHTRLKPMDIRQFAKLRDLGLFRCAAMVRIELGGS